MLLRNKDKERLVQIFLTVDFPIEVWAFGSRVSGAAHSGSDLDLVVRSRHLQKIPIDVLLSLKEKIRESNIPILVELHDWARLPESFHQNIETHYEVLFSNLEVMVNEPPAPYQKKSGNPDKLENEEDK